MTVQQVKGYINRIKRGSSTHTNAPEAAKDAANAAKAQTQGVGRRRGAHVEMVNDWPVPRTSCFEPECIGYYRNGRCRVQVAER